MTSRKKILWSILIGATLVCAVLGLTIARTLKIRPAPAVVTSNQIPGGAVQNVRFTLYDGGIFPRQHHANPGNVAISIEDRTHRSEGLVVQRETDGMMLDIGQVRAVVNQARRGRAQFRLGVGNYRVFDASQPNNGAELIIEP